MVLPCHELSSLSSPTWRPGWRIRARVFFDSEHAVAVTRFSGSVATVIAVSVIAVRSVGSRPFANNGAKPNRRHQHSPEGRLDHRDRQRGYRKRCTQRRVTINLPLRSPRRARCLRGISDPRKPLPESAPPPLPSGFGRCRPGENRRQSIGRPFFAVLSVAGAVASSIPFPPSRAIGAEALMINAETRAQIRQWFFAEHWKIGTISQELGVHPDTVRHAIESDRFHRAQTLRPCLTDPYLPFLRQTLDQHPRLRATRIYQMIRERGYTGSVIQLRRVVATLRPARPEPFLRLHTFPAEQAQVDWAHFGEVQVGRARRRLSCFLITLSYSRALYLEFFFDQTLENFLRGHVHAFEAWSGQPRVILHDNLRSAVLERRGDQVHFHPRLLELCAHYYCLPRPCQVRAGNQKGRVERAIRYVRESFWARAVLSPPCQSAIVRLSSGEMKWHISGPGPEMTRARSRWLSLKSNRACYPYPYTPSPPI